MPSRFALVRWAEAVCLWLRCAHKAKCEEISPGNCLGTLSRVEVRKSGFDIAPHYLL